MHDPSARSKDLRLTAALAGISLALLVALTWSLTRLPRTGVSDAEVREQAVLELVRKGSGVFDTHPDPDVGKLLQPGLEEREGEETRLSTNRYGLREREHVWTKPDGTVRVVLLGDSYVMGYGVPAEDRVGVFLEQYLTERAGSKAEVECLHFGVSSWNAVAEATFVRRQLGDLRPDLVVQVIVRNDLNDLTGVRGFGATGRFTPQARSHADGIVRRRSQQELWGLRTPNPLLFGLDGESRGRWEEAGVAIERLARAVEAHGGTFLLVAMIPGFHSLVERYVASEVAPAEVVYLSSEFAMADEYRRAPSDPHWNRAGHEVVAKLLYGVAQERVLLPGLELAPWEEASGLVRGILDAGLAEAQSDEALRALTAELALTSELTFPSESPRVAGQVYGGVDSQGRVAPYASLVLARGGGGTLVLEGRRLGRPELTGGIARVYADEVLLEEIPLDGDRAFSFGLPLSDELARRDHIALRFECDDWVYDFDRSWRCVAFALERAAIVR